MQTYNSGCYSEIALIKEYWLTGRQMDEQTCELLIRQANEQEQTTGNIALVACMKEKHLEAKAGGRSRFTEEKLKNIHRKN